MKRLTHSHNGFLRTMQISRYSLFVFIEGKTNDPVFYDNICKPECERLSIEYKLIQSQEIPGTLRGKRSLIMFYRFLRKKKKLIENFKNKKTGVVFFLDKDIDDLTSKKCKSCHVIYTEYYTIENYLIKEGNLLRAISSATSVEPKYLNSIFSDNLQWRKSCVERWTEWLVLCIYSMKNKLNCGCSYSSISRINSDRYGGLESNLFSDFQECLKAEAGLNDQEFTTSFSRQVLNVNKYIKSNNFDQIFKGKWYLGFIVYDFKKTIGNKPHISQSLEARIESALLATIDYDMDWTKKLRNSLNLVLTKF